jgi:hypothetical protein
MCRPATVPEIYTQIERLDAKIASEIEAELQLKTGAINGMSMAGVCETLYGLRQL